MILNYSHTHTLTLLRFYISGVPITMSPYINASLKIGVYTYVCVCMYV